MVDVVDLRLLAEDQATQKIRELRAQLNELNNSVEQNNRRWGEFAAGRYFERQTAILRTQVGEQVSQLKLLEAAHQNAQRVANSTIFDQPAKSARASAQAFTELNNAVAAGSRDRLYDLQRQLDIASQLSNSRDSETRAIRAQVEARQELATAEARANREFDLQRRLQLAVAADPVIAAQTNQRAAFDATTRAYERQAAAQKAAAADMIASLRQTTAEASKAADGAFRFAQQIAPATRISFVQAEEGLKAVERGLQNTTQGLESISRGAGAANREIRHVVAAVDELSRGQRGAFFSTVGAGLRDAGLSAGVLFGALGAFGALAAVNRLTRDFAELADKTINAAAAAGMSVDEFSLLQRTMQLVGGDAEKSVRVFGQLSTQIETALDQPASKARSAFDALGISTEQLAEGLKHPADFLELLRQKFQELGPSLQRTEIFRALLGRGFQELVPWLELTSAQMTRLQREAKESGSVMSDRTAKALQEVYIESNRLSESLSGLGLAFAQIAANTRIVDFLSDVAQGWTKIINAIDNLSQKPLPRWMEVAMGLPQRMMGMIPFPITPTEVSTSNVAALPAGATVQTTLDLIKQLEHSGPRAVSSAGAVGEYQILPSTAKQYGFDPARLFDPQYNETVARAIVADLMQRYKNNLKDVLTAYHSGPGAVGGQLGPEGRGYLAKAAQLTGDVGLASSGASQATGVMTDIAAIQKEMNERIKAEVSDVTKLKLSELDKEKAANRFNVDAINAIDAQRKTFLEAQVAAETKIRTEAADKVAASAQAAGDKDRMRIADEMRDTARIQAEKNQIERQGISDEIEGRIRSFNAFKQIEDAKIQTARSAAERLKYYQEIAAAAPTMLPAGAPEILQAQTALASAKRQAAQESERDRERELAADMRESSIRLRTAVFTEDQKVKHRQETAAQALTIERALTQQLESEDIKRMQDFLATLDPQSEAFKEMTLKIEEAQLKMSEDIARIDDKIAADAKKTADEWAKPFRTALDGVGSAMETFVNAGIMRTETLKKALQTLTTSIGGDLLKAVESLGSKLAASALGATGGQGLGDFLGEKISSLFNLGTSAGGSAAAATAMTSAMTVGGTTAATTIGTAMTTAGAAVATEIGAAMTAGGAASAAGGAASGGLDALGFLTKIPSIIGMFGFAQGGVVPSAAGGMIAGGGTVAILHPNEMVLPAPISRGLQSMIANQNEPGANVSVNPVYNTNITGRPFVTRADAEEMARSHGSVWEAHARNYLRNRGMRL